MKLNLFFALFFVTLVSGAQTPSIEGYKDYQEKGRALILEGKYDSAIHMLDTGLVKMPYSHSMYYERGYAYMQLQDYEKAIANFSHLIEQADYKYSAYLNRGICFFELNQFEKAKEDFNRTLALDPDNSTARQFLEETNRAINTYKNNTNSNSSYDQSIAARQQQLEQQLIDRRRDREARFWGTVIPLVFWSTVFLTW